MRLLILHATRRFVAMPDKFSFVEIRRGRAWRVYCVRQANIWR
ncbi:hypothetical protein [Nitrosomonas eutropha]|nr:hypothetical protein [Nitrosomonas eutropha]